MCRWASLLGNICRSCKRNLINMISNTSNSCSPVTICLFKTFRRACSRLRQLTKSTTRVEKKWPFIGKDTKKGSLVPIQHLPHINPYTQFFFFFLFDHKSIPRHYPISLDTQRMAFHVALLSTPSSLFICGWR